MSKKLVDTYRRKASNGAVLFSTWYDDLTCYMVTIHPDGTESKGWLGPVTEEEKQQEIAGAEKLDLNEKHGYEQEDNR